MGACTFQTTIGGKGMSPADAYESLVEEAERFYGTNPYNGTISTTSGFVMVDPGRRRIEKVISDELNNSGSHVRKFGPAGCIQLSGVRLTKWRKHAGLAGTRAKAYVFFGRAAE